MGYAILGKYPRQEDKMWRFAASRKVWKEKRHGIPVKSKEKKHVEVSTTEDAARILHDFLNLASGIARVGLIVDSPAKPGVKRKKSACQTIEWMVRARRASEIEASTDPLASPPFKISPW